jgi:predicted N-acetyltransferase YhbS
MSEVTVRPAAPGDFEAVAQLLGELGRPEVTAETRAAAEAVHQRHLARPDAASLVAEIGGRVVGFMSLGFRDRLNQTRPQAWIPDLIVSAAARRRGAGGALLRRGIELARARDCWSVTLESGHQRHEAHARHRSAGLRDEGLYFRLHLNHP